MVRWSKLGGGAILALGRKMSYEDARAIVEAMIVLQPEHSITHPPAGRESKARELHAADIGLVSFGHYFRIGPLDSIGSVVNRYVSADARQEYTAQFGWPGGGDVVMLWSYEEQLPASNPDMVAYLMGRFRATIQSLQPAFAAIDHLGRALKGKREGDIRRRAWGVMAFGSDLVEIIGRSTIKTCPAVRVEDLPGGGMWVQLDENPFLPNPKVRAAAAAHLGLAGRWK